MAEGSFFGRLRESMGKTRSRLADGLRGVFLGRARIDDSVYEELEAVLIQADVGVETTTQLIVEMKARAREEGLSTGEELYAALRQELARLLQSGGTAHQPATNPAITDHTVHWSQADGPHVTLVAGVNGSGKTTTTGKLAAKLRAQGRSVVMGAADTFRAAAAEQLTIWSERSGAEIVKSVEGADPASVAYDTVDKAVARSADNVIIDTAGRLHTKVNLMEELKKVQRVVSKRLPGAPHEVLLVLDATTGQNGLQQARLFTEALTVTGIVLTKLDGTAKGGMAIAIQRQLGISIKYIGVGEGIDDLQPFDADAFVAALFD
jgi:fused signal recognition particle receptor